MLRAVLALADHILQTSCYRSVSALRSKFDSFGMRLKLQPVLPCNLPRQSIGLPRLYQRSCKICSPLTVMEAPDECDCQLLSKVKTDSIPRSAAN